MGLAMHFHGDELNDMGSGELAAAIGAKSVSHLEKLSREGIHAMAKAGVTGVLLPTTAHVLRLVPPPARDMIDAGVPVVLASDYNPNAMWMEMPAVMQLACVRTRAAIILGCCWLTRANSFSCFEVSFTRCVSIGTII